jgi:hypothetical protein
MTQNRQFLEHLQWCSVCDPACIVKLDERNPTTYARFDSAKWFWLRIIAAQVAVAGKRLHQRSAPAEKECSK